MNKDIKIYGIIFIVGFCGFMTFSTHKLHSKIKRDLKKPNLSRQIFQNNMNKDLDSIAQKFYDHDKEKFKKIMEIKKRKKESFIFVRDLLGFQVTFIHDLPVTLNLTDQTIMGFVLFFNKDICKIFVNANLDDDSKKRVLGHELYHCIYHNNNETFNEIYTKDYFSRNFEKEANQNQISVSKIPSIEKLVEEFNNYQHQYKYMEILSYE